MKNSLYEENPQKHRKSRGTLPDSLKQGLCVLNPDQFLSSLKLDVRHIMQHDNSWVLFLSLTRKEDEKAA
jgi:hypothetical protein